MATADQVYPSDQTPRIESQESVEEAPVLSTEEKEGLHKMFGRDTELGREIFRLYNKGKVQYKPTVQIKTKRSNPHEEHEKKLAAERAAKAKKGEVAYPQPAPKPIRQPKFFELGQGRKPQVAIEHQMKKDFKKDDQVFTKKFLSREAQIAALQSKFEDPNKQQSLAPVRRRQQPVELVEAVPEEVLLFQAVTAEIEERQCYLRELEQMGRAAPHAGRVRIEIAERVEELRKLKALIDEKGA